MPRNIEIKARARDWERQRTVAARLASSREELRQFDVFFKVKGGRLKLRRLSGGEAQLIFYRRPERSGPKTSDYFVAPVADPAGLRRALAFGLGERGTVEKRRTVFQIGRTRVHFDDVRGLGRFIELEVLLKRGESAAAGRREAEVLMLILGIAKADLVSGAYADLM